MKRSIDGVSQKQVRIAVVVQRFGKGIVGGSEQLAMEYALRMTRDLGWAVDIFTTTSTDHNTWKNDLTEGAEDFEKNLRVFRFHVKKPRATRRFAIYKRLSRPFLAVCQLVKGLSFFAKRIEKLWIHLQGPVCPDLIDSLVQHEDTYDRIFFFTYLYWPTIHGLPIFSHKSVLVPTAHDEIPFFFSIVKDSMSSAKFCLANTESERRLLESQIPKWRTNIRRAGVGIGDSLKSRKLQKRKLPEQYFLYLGRISQGKNVDRMIGWWYEFLTMNPDYKGYKLRLAGRIDPKYNVDVQPEKLEILGYLSEEEKYRQIENATATINPSSYESLSLVVIESLALGTSAIVNGKCEVLADYSKNVDIVKKYTSKEEFFVSLKEAILFQRDQRQFEKRQLAKDWVNSEFNWPRVLKVIESTVLHQ